MPQFSTEESVSLAKDVELKGKLIHTNPIEIDKLYDVQKCVDWIVQNGFQKVCLQFPDHLLPDSSDVALKLQDNLGQTVYILGDTAYESCCVDYVAAAHINADAVIHFGPTCFSKTSENIPYLNVYEKHPINFGNLEAFLRTFECKNKQDLVLLLDDGYVYCYDDVCRIFKEERTIEICRIDEDLSNLTNKNVIFVGSNQRKLMNIDLSCKPKSLYHFDPNKSTPPDIIPFQPESKILKKRYFLIEKIKDANTIGIVIGTLAVKNYLKIIERVKRLAELCGKKYYLISVGKPTVAKLANLGEIDIYVMITCSMNEIYDSRDFYKPLVTPYDVEMALNSNASNIQFTYDYNRYLESLGHFDSMKRSEAETEVSLLTGQLRSNITGNDEISVDTTNDSQVAIKAEGTLALDSNFGAGFLNERSWKGLEQNLGQTEVKLAEKGRKGIAQEYQNEKL